ncbi:MAG: GTP cyclohydrolase II [Bryobacteraceae bacterium]
MKKQLRPFEIGSGTYVIRQGFVWVVSSFSTFRPDEGHVSEDHVVLAHTPRLTAGYRDSGCRACTLPTTAWFEPSDHGVLVRIHSECLLSEVFGFEMCDCREQLTEAMNTITAEGSGVVIYMRQEGRGIGLAAKLRTLNSDDSLDTYQRNVGAGYPEDGRRFDAAAEALGYLNITEIRLISDSPLKMAALSNCGIHISERVGLQYPVTPEAARELLAKKRRGYHIQHTEEVLVAMAGPMNHDGNAGR